MNQRLNNLAARARTAAVELEQAIIDMQDQSTRANLSDWSTGDALVGEVERDRLNGQTDDLDVEVLWENYNDDPECEIHIEFYKFDRSAEGLTQAEWDRGWAEVINENNDYDEDEQEDEDDLLRRYIDDNGQRPDNRWHAYINVPNNRLSDSGRSYGSRSTCHEVPDAVAVMLDRTIDSQP